MATVRRKLTAAGVPHFVNPSHIVEPTPQGVPGPARPAEPAHVIRDDAEAIRVAHALAAGFREGASERDRTGARPLAELDAFSQSGLWSINVPRSHGGPEVSYRTLAQVIAIVAAADPSIAQIAQKRFGVARVIARVLDPARAAWYAEQGLETICPTQFAITEFERALGVGA